MYRRDYEEVIKELQREIIRLRAENLGLKAEVEENRRKELLDLRDGVLRILGSMRNTDSGSKDSTTFLE